MLYTALADLQQQSEVIALPPFPPSLHAISIAIFSVHCGVPRTSGSVGSVDGMGTSTISCRDAVP